MRPQDTEVIEFDWNEGTEIATWTLEGTRDGAITFKTLHRPLKRPEVNAALRDSYFSNLLFWLETQT